MSCFFPSIFKKNTYKKVRFFFVSALVLIIVLSFSGCKAIKTAVSLPFKGIGWVGDKIAGDKDSEAQEKPLEGGSGDSNELSGPTTSNGEDVINFDPLVMWAIILIGIALIVRFLFNKYVARNSKE